MLYYVDVIVIYDGKEYGKYTVSRSTSRNLWRTLYPEVVRVCGDGIKGSIKENGTHGAVDVL